MTSYYDQNRAELLEKKKTYYQANKDRINEKARNNKTQCECGSLFGKDHKKRHYESKKHTQFMEAARDLYGDFVTSECNTESSKKN